MAAPHVAAAAALIAWREGKAQAALRSALAAAVDDLGPAGRDPAFGYGRLNLCKALGGACAYTPGGASQPVAAGPPLDRTPPRVRAAWPARVDLRTARRSGIRVVCGSNEAARCTLSAELRGSAAKRLGFRGTIPIGEASAELSGAGTVTLEARLSPSAARALRSRRRATLNLKLTVTDRSGNRRVVSKRLKLA